MTRTANRQLVRELRRWVWKPDPELVDLFATMGVPQLRDVLAAGTLTETVDHEEVANYCKIAALRWSDHPELGKAALSGTGDAALATAQLIDLFRFNVVYTISGDIIDERDDSVTIKTPRGPLEVTDAKLQHWEWMLTILTDERAARAVLEQAPESSRALAEETVILAFAQDFDDVVARARDQMDMAQDDD